MNRFLFALLLTMLICLNIKAADTVRVATHRRVTVVTDPSTGNKSYKRWGVFPVKPDQVRKILMRVKFGCPDSLRCADWDYSDRISIRRVGGVKGKDENYELGRMLTPYGGAFGKDWKFEWELNVTDFSLLLQDSVEVEYNHSGYEPNTDRGWAITVEFEVIKGKPARLPLAIQKVYDAGFAYGDAKNPIDKQLAPVSFTAVQKANTARLRVVQTGHGMDRPDGCGEFCSKYREVWYDGQLVNKRYLWKECGDNALYPQAGTWVIDRANWCPGDLVPPDNFDLSVTPGGQHTVQFRMQNYEATQPSAAEVISAYLVQYAAGPAYDVAVEDVIVPSSKFKHGRMNPATVNPAVLVANQGSATIRTLNLLYSFGREEKSYHWTGELKPFSTDTLIIPVSIPSGGASFRVLLKDPGGKKDAYAADNEMAVSYIPAPVLDQRLVMNILTNKQPEQTSYRLTDAGGEIVYQRKAGTLEAQKLYNDTLQLAAGAYRLLLEDNGNDGLEFWFNTRAGAGYAMLKNAKNQLLKNFDPDFGSYASLQFYVDGAEHPANPALGSYRLYPTRTNDKTTFQYLANTPEDVTIQLVADPGGEIAEEHVYKNLQAGEFVYDLSRFPKGRFYLKVFVKGELKFNKRIRLKE